jgi:hypothetical protein
MKFTIILNIFLIQWYFSIQQTCNDVCFKLYDGELCKNECIKIETTECLDCRINKIKIYPTYVRVPLDNGNSYYKIDKCFCGKSDKELEQVIKKENTIIYQIDEKTVNVYALEKLYIRGSEKVKYKTSSATEHLLIEDSFKCKLEKVKN